MRSGLLRRLEPCRIVDRRGIGERHDGPHRRRRHQQPGSCIRACHRAHALLKDVELAQQNRAHREQRLADRLQVAMTLHQFLDASGKAPRRGFANLQPEAAQDTAQAVLDVQELALDQLARGQDRSCFLRTQRLAVHRPEPAEPHQLRDAARVIAVRLHRHRLERLPHVPCLQQFDRQPRFPRCRIKPLRQRPGFQPDPAQFIAQRPQPADQRFRLAGCLAFPNNLAVAIHNAHTRAFQ